MDSEVTDASDPVRAFMIRMAQNKKPKAKAKP